MKPRIEIVFRKGRPTSAFLHLKDGVSGKSGRQIPIRPPMVAHYDGAGHPSGLEIPLPLTVHVLQINEALRELGAEPIDEASLEPLQKL